MLEGKHHGKKPGEENDLVATRALSLDAISSCSIPLVSEREKVPIPEASPAPTVTGLPRGCTSFKGCIALFWERHHPKS